MGPWDSSLLCPHNRGDPMSTSTDFDWVVQVQESQYADMLPRSSRACQENRFYASATHATRTTEVRDGDRVRMVPLRLVTGWEPTKQAAIMAAGVLISAYESGIPR